jgi:hypothetical protein
VPLYRYVRFECIRSEMKICVAQKWLTFCLFEEPYILNRIRYSAVGTATGYGLYDQGMEFESS